MNHWKEILDALAEIKAAKGNAKHPLILKHINENYYFTQVVWYTLNTSLTYKISKAKKVHKTPYQNEELYEFLEHMNDRKGATNEDRAIIAEIAAEDPEGYKLQVINRILSRKLDCGCTVKTLNNIKPGFVPYFPYMRCSDLAMIHKITFPCYSQVKADGEYFDIFCSKDVDTVFQTRNGKVADFSLVDTSAFEELGNSKVSGEALLWKEDRSGYEDRKDGNAIINKALYGGLSQEEADRIDFAFWDIVFRDEVPSHYIMRWKDLQELNLPIVECKKVNNMEEAWKHYENVRSQKLEGTILKNFNGYWKDGTSSNQIKLKAEKECELEVYDTVPGGGKYKGMVGSLMCQSSCGRLLTDVGMGLSDEDRKRDDWIGQIITVRFNTISRSKWKNTWAMTHARLVDDRPDKHEADDIAYIKAVKEVKRRK